jgi:Gram-negative bacterial TonB protein C-terminal
MLRVKWHPARAISLIALLSASFVLAQDRNRELPLVITGKVPLYPIEARAARIQGTVKVKVTTDGERVTSVQAESGPPMLVKFVKENVLTWEFTRHKPTKFETTFEYLLEGPEECSYSNGKSVLALPLEVRISAHGIKTCDPSTKTGSGQ